MLVPGVQFTHQPTTGNEMTQVTYETKTGQQVVETYPVQHENGFKPDWNLRAKALGWTVIKVEQV